MKFPELLFFSQKIKTLLSKTQFRTQSISTQLLKTKSIYLLFIYYYLLLVFRYNSEDLWWSIAYFRKGVKIYQCTCRCFWLLADVPPPPELKELKLVRAVCDGEWDCTIACAWGRWTLNMNTIDSLAFMFSLKIGRQCTPPPQNEKVGFQVKVTFCFWLLAPPPPEIEIGLNMNAIGTKIISREVIKYILPIYPPSSITIIWFYAWAGNWWISISNGYLDSNPIHHPSPARKRWNAHFWITFNSWWSAGLVDGLKPHLPPFSSQKKWNAHFWITFNFWWSARLVEWLEPHPPPFSSKKNEMLIFGLHSTSDDRLGWSMDSNPIHHPSPAKKIKCSFLDYVQHLMIGQAGRWTQTPSTTPLQPKKWNAHFWITFNFWWSARLVDGPECHPPPLSSQKNEMLIFGLHSTSDDQPGWLMDSNPIRHPSLAKKMKYSFLDYVQLLMIGWAAQWTWNPSATPLQPKKMKCSFLDYIQLLIFSWASWWTQTPSAPYNIRKVGFCLSCNFSDLFPLKWLRMANFIRFTTFLIFSHRRGSEWLGTANFAWFATFLIFFH